MWNFVPTDDFSLKQLQDWEKFFKKDLKAAIDYLKTVTKIVKRLKRGSWMIKAAKKDVTISKNNLRKITTAIKIAKKRNK